MASRDPPDLAQNNDTKRLRVEATEPAKVECWQLVPDGDVMLIVGPKKEKIQISSHLLYITSPFFKKMLNSDFKEGKAFRERNGAPAEIELPKDSPEAVIYDIAVMADKYQMVDRFTMATPYLLRPRTLDPAPTWRMIVAAYLLKSETGFFNFSGEFIKSRGLSLVKHASSAPDRVLALKLCLAIEEFRNRGGKINKGLCLYCFNKGEESGRGFVTKDPRCKFASHYAV